MTVRVLFHVQHLLGIGHLTRAAALARACAEDGMEVTVASGGEPVPGVDFGRASLVAAPPRAGGRPPVQGAAGRARGAGGRRMAGAPARQAARRLRSGTPRRRLDRAVPVRTAPAPLRAAPAPRPVRGGSGARRPAPHRLLGTGRPGGVPEARAAPGRPWTSCAGTTTSCSSTGTRASFPSTPPSPMRPGSRTGSRTRATSSTVRRPRRRFRPNRRPRRPNREHPPRRNRAAVR